HAKVALPQRLNPPPRTRVRNRCATPLDPHRYSGYDTTVPWRAPPRAQSRGGICPAIPTAASFWERQPARLPSPSFPATWWRAPARSPPSDKITLAHIGTGTEGL